MSRQLNPSQVWSQVPVANRLIEVNTKTGFSLTAGSYSVRASSTQRGSGTAYGIGAAGGTVTISSVTTTRAQEVFNGSTTDDASTSPQNYQVRCSLTSSTTVAGVKTGSTGNSIWFTVVQEFF